MSFDMASTRRMLLARADLLLVILASPLLLLPRGPLPWIGLTLLLASWLWRGITTRQVFVRTSLDYPIMAITLMTPVSLYPSVDLSLSMPKLYVILLGLSVYYATVSNVSSGRHLRIGIIFLISSIVAVSLVGLVGADWLAHKYPVLDRVYEMIPRLITGVQSSVGPATGINANELGGTIAFLLPLPLAVALRCRLSRSGWIVLVGAVLLGLLALLLAASRSSFLGLAVAVLFLLAWRWHRVLIALPVIAASVVGVVLAVNSQAIVGLLGRIDAASVASGEAISLSNRLEIWPRALYMIEDMPFTGIGLNTFPVVFHTFYPSLISGTGTLIAHAHNIFLQTAIDLGMGGLLGFLGLWAGVFYAGCQVCRRDPASGLAQTPIPEQSPQHRNIQATIVGLMAGLFSYLVYGLTDAISLGAKPTVLLWLMMGLIVAAQRLTGESENGADQWTERRPFQRSHGTVPPDAIRTSDTSVSQLQTAEALTEGHATRALSPATGTFLQRGFVARVLAAASDAYWMITFFLVGMAYLTIVLSIFGWTL